MSKFSINFFLYEISVFTKPISAVNWFYFYSTLKLDWWWTVNNNRQDPTCDSHSPQRIGLQDGGYLPRNSSEQSPTRVPSSRMPKLIFLKTKLLIRVQLYHFILPDLYRTSKPHLRFGIVAWGTYFQNHINGKYQ